MSDSKAEVEGFFESAMLDIAPFDIDVMIVDPGQRTH